MKQALDRQQKVITSMFKRSKKSFGNTQSSISDFSNFLSGANAKLKKLPKPKKSELEKLKLKDFSNLAGGGGRGGLLGGLAAGIGGLATAGIAGKATKGIKGMFDKKIGKEISQEGTEKLGKVAAKEIGKETVEQTAKKVGTKTLEKGAAKMLGKKIPLVGAALGTVFAVERAMRGDWLGATGELASGVASTIPGAGTAVSLGIDAALITKDVKDTGTPTTKDKSKEKQVTKPAAASIAQQSDIKTQQRMGFAPGTSTAGDQMLDIKAFERVVEKFGQLANMGLLSGTSTHDEGSSEGDEGGSGDPPPDGDPYNGPIDGNQFWPLPGGVLSNRSNGYPGGEYGAQRSYGPHSGQDIGGKDAGSAVVAWKTGKVSFTGSVESGDTIISIDHGGGIKSVYKHVVPTVPAGTTVYGGQQIATLFNARAYAPHLHFEVWRNGSHTNPNADLGQSQKISAPLDPAKAKQNYEKNAGSVSPGAGANPSGLTYTGAAAQKSTVIGDSIAKGLADQMGTSNKFTKVGADVKDVRQFAEQAASEGAIGGKNIILSSGISNNTSQLSEVRDLIKYLQSQGAAGVQLAGTSNDRTDLKKMNPKLMALAMEFGGFVQFGGGFAAPDKIHPEYAKYLKTLQSIKTNAYNQQRQSAISSIYTNNQQSNTQVILGLQQPAQPQAQQPVGSAAPASAVSSLYNWSTNPDPLLVKLGSQ